MDRDKCLKLPVHSAARKIQFRLSQEATDLFCAEIALEHNADKFRFIQRPRISQRSQIYSDDSDLSEDLAVSENQKTQNLRQFLRRLLMRFERVLYAVPISSASKDKWGAEILIVLK